MIISFKTKIRNCRPRRELPKRMIGLISGQRRGYRKPGGNGRHKDTVEEGVQGNPIKD